MRKSYDNILVYTFELLENPRTNVHVNAAIQGVAFSVSLPGGSGGGRLTGSERSGALRVRVLRNREGVARSVGGIDSSEGGGIGSGAVVVVFVGRFCEVKELRRELKERSQ